MRGDPGGHPRVLRRTSGHGPAAGAGDRCDRGDQPRRPSKIDVRVRSAQGPVCRGGLVGPRDQAVRALAGRVHRAAHRCAPGAQRQPHQGQHAGHRERGPCPPAGPLPALLRLYRPQCWGAAALGATRGVNKEPRSTQKKKRVPLVMDCPLHTRVLAYAAIVYTISCAVYLVVTRFVDTPFFDTLSDEQIKIRRGSSRKRALVFFVSLVCTGVAVTLWNPLGFPDRGGYDI